jgi:hypothetical protein
MVTVFYETGYGIGPGTDSIVFGENGDGALHVTAGGKGVVKQAVYLPDYSIFVDVSVGRLEMTGYFRYVIV